MEELEDDELTEQEAAARHAAKQQQPQPRNKQRRIKKRLKPNQKQSFDRITLSGDELAFILEQQELAKMHRVKFLRFMFILDMILQTTRRIW